ncbi:MAG: nuclear transport factor 2 family protein [Chitinophagaceae bacterium]|nr:MAG: nuclear transport factor 2 family protein [Chitinophagaceae bacterium]
MNEQELNEFKKYHIDGWNEKDRLKRDELLGNIYAPDIVMYDDTAVFSGLTAISDFIGSLREQDPDFQFFSDKPMESVQNSIRFYGHIRTTQGMLNSMDFFILKDGKAIQLYAYMAPGD